MIAPNLGPQEREVVRGLLAGLTQKTIAKRLSPIQTHAHRAKQIGSISRPTVRYHINKVKHKLLAANPKCAAINGGHTAFILLLARAYPDLCPRHEEAA